MIGLLFLASGIFTGNDLNRVPQRVYERLRISLHLGGASGGRDLRGQP